MLVKKIEGNLEKIKAWNCNAEELKRTMPTGNWDKCIITSIDDKLKPYSKWNEKLKEWAKDGELDVKIIEDEEISFDGVFLTGANPNYTIELLSDVKVVKGEDRFPYVDYGVCDNATQAINHYNNLLKEHVLNEDKKYIITLHRIYKGNEPEYGGWRWHKHGKYIGIQEPTCEYIYDEEDIDLVYCFTILELEF